MARKSKKEIHSKSEDELRHIELGWKILEAKILYYEPPAELMNAGLDISDSEYDSMELEYLGLCVRLNKPNTVVHKEYPGFDFNKIGHGMMEVDWSRPSASAALRKLYVKAGIPENQRRDFGTWHSSKRKKK